MFRGGSSRIQLDTEDYMAQQLHSDQTLRYNRRRLILLPCRVTVQQRRPGGPKTGIK